MKRAVRSRQARRVLDARLAQVGPVDRFTPPTLGWVRAVRDALGMSAADLGARLGISAASVSSIESKERSGGVRLSTLERVAEAMGCTLVYALVPNTSLETIVLRQADCVVSEQDLYLRQTMALEAQEALASPQFRREQAESLMDSRRLWKVRTGNPANGR